MSTPRESTRQVPTQAPAAPNANVGAHASEAKAAAPSAGPEFKVYKPPAIASPQENLPDDYFTPTIADLKARQEQLHARAASLNNAPMLTRAQREQQTKAKRDRWPNVRGSTPASLSRAFETTIRVRFPDRTQLEKTFPSSNKIRSVYAFVRDSLREDVKPIKFILCSNPPPRDLKVSDPAVRDLTLAELELAPSSILHLRFVDDSLNRSDLPAPLASAVLEHAVDLPAPRGFDGNQKREDASSAVSAPGSSSRRGGEVKVPKWLKLGSKK
ncbi:hypothetical protein BJV78DRAFT_631995 [Lactifluus subvellereus]|nr:hypothetical protein BJV78DRAFT_631995 [Lactifluus subvellereus]